MIEQTIVLSPPVRIALAAAVALMAFPAAAWLAAGVRRAARKAHAVEHVDATLAGFFAEVARVAILVGALVVVLTLAGVEPTSVATVLGAATLAVGLALQTTLSNVAAGVIIIVFRPYRVNDLVEIAGRRGVVRVVSLFFTEITTAQNYKVVVPNSQALSQALLNLSAGDHRRVDLEVTLAWDTDGPAACAAVEAALAGDARVRAEPFALEVAIAKLNDRGPVLAIQAWAASKDAPGLAHDLPAIAHGALRAGGFTGAGPA